MGKKVSSVTSYFCAMPMFEDIRKLYYKGQAQVCKTFRQYLKNTAMRSKNNFVKEMIGVITCVIEVTQY